jgi:hypothetical protein
VGFPLTSPICLAYLLKKIQQKFSHNKVHFVFKLEKKTSKNILSFLGKQNPNATTNWNLHFGVGGRWTPTNLELTQFWPDHWKKNSWSIIMDCTNKF